MSIQSHIRKSLIFCLIILSLGAFSSMWAISKDFVETPWEDPFHPKQEFANNYEGVTIESYYEKPGAIDALDTNPPFKEQNNEIETAKNDNHVNHVNQDNHVYQFNPDNHDKHANTDIHNPPLIGPPYRLQRGDQLIISVYGDTATTKKLVTVDPTGAISYLFIKHMFVLGKTFNEVRTELAEKLKSYYRHVLVVMTPIQLNGSFYTISGEVNTPGKKPILGKSTVLSAICEAHGFTTRLFRNQTVDRANLDHSFLARNGEYIPVDFIGLVRDGDLSKDVPIIPGDYIYIAKEDTGQIFVIGEVLQPASIQFFHEMSLIEAITQAGGMTRFSSSRVAVIRGSLACPEEFLIDINLIKKGYACDFWLQPGDIVYVPPMKFTTLKEIIKDGIRAFVGTAFSVAGEAAFVGCEPGALGLTGGFAPVPVINTSGSLGGVGGGVGTVIAPAVGH